VTRLLTAFYFRCSGSDSTGEETFEFTHKSFGEYLTAKRIVREVRLIQKKVTARQSDPDEGWDEREALHRWSVLCGSTTMDEYLFNFILNEVRLQYQVDAAEVATWQQTFCSLMGLMLRQGMPMERLDPRPSYQEESRQALNAEDSLLAVLGVFQRLTQAISNIDFPSREAFGVLLARLHGQRAIYSNPMSFQGLTFLNLSFCILIARDLSGADLSGANLSGADLSGAYLIEANLSGANLSRAELSRANLFGAYLIEANLSRAYLIEANLSRAGLIDANLSGANLIEANLIEANLSGANLIEANLSRANLSGADLSGANLSGANLSGANLSREQLNSAKVTEHTQLPK
jgi:uncharacterized protein YjbI with pentapeptide repeats